MPKAETRTTLTYQTRLKRIR